MSTKLAELTATLKRFVEVECIPGERVFDQEMRASTNRWGAVPTVLEKLKLRAKCRCVLLCLFLGVFLDQRRVQGAWPVEPLDNKGVRPSDSRWRPRVWSKFRCDRPVPIWCCVRFEGAMA